MFLSHQSDAEKARYIVSIVRENYFLYRGFMRRRFADGVQSESLKNHSRPDAE